MPQVPQFVFVASDSQPLAVFPSHSSVPPAQPAVQTPATQLSPPPHGLPQLPQLAELVLMFTSQASDASRLQSRVVPVHAPQAVPEQVCVRAVQATLQAPQWAFEARSSQPLAVFPSHSS